MLTAGDLRTVLIPTPVKTSAYTAHHGDFVLVDTTAGSVTVTLPLNPPQNSAVGLKQVATAGGHTVTVAAPGASSFNLQGGGTTLTLTLPGQGVMLQYSSGVWVVQSDDLPLAQLDARYSVSMAAAGQSGGLSATGYAGASVNILVAAAAAPTSATWTGGSAYGQLVFCNPGAAVNGFVTIYPWLGNASLAGTFIGLYNSSGVQLGTTADLSAQATASRGLRVAVTGFTAAPPDGKVYVLYANATAAAGGAYLVSPGITHSFGQVTPLSSTIPMGFVIATGGLPASLSFTNGIPSGANAGSPQFFPCLLD